MSMECCRLGSQRKRLQTLRELGVAEEDIEPALAYLGRSERTLEQYLEWVFDRRGQAAQLMSRFTDGKLPVVYTALDVRTAVAEIIFHLDPPTDGSAMYLQQIDFDYSGETLDLREHGDIFSFASDPNTSSYSACIKFATEAVAQRIQALLHTSARDPTGSCLPIFSRSSIIAWRDGPFYRIVHDGDHWDHRQM